MGILARLLPWRRRAETAVRTPAHPPRDQSARAARALGDSLDRAMASGRWARATRIGATAERLAPHWPHLTEKLARLHLVHGRPQIAMGLIAACRRSTHTLELLGAISHIDMGRTDHAHAELVKAARGSKATAEARRMLALVEWEQGDEHAATMELLRNLKYGEDPRTLELLMLLAVTQDRREQAAVWARRLQQTSSLTEDPAWGALLRCSLQLDDARPRSVVRQEDINRLGTALLAREPVIPALVTAQRVRPTAHVIEALAAAIEHVLPRLTDEPAALEALAVLAVLRKDRNAAQAWLDRFFARCTPNGNMVRLRRALERTKDPRRERGVVGRIGFRDTTGQERAA